MPTSPLRVGLVFGGASGEHDVSIRSASTVIKALADASNRERFQVTPLYIDREGRWWPDTIAQRVLQQMAAHVKNATGGNIRFLRKIEPEGLNAVAGNGGWEEIEFNVDSGATETVVGKSMLLSVEVKEGSQKRRGVEYEVANGEMIPNLG